MGRFRRGLDRLRGVVPEGADLRALHALVEDVLVDEGGLEDLLGRRHIRLGDDGPTDIPRLRPILVALAARSVGAAEVDEDTQYVAELLHMALTVHDFALGREGGRRRRVARRLARTSVNWLGGNHLTLRALEVARYSRPEILEELVDTLRHFADSQALAQELRAVGGLPTEDEWLEHADGHTGALFMFCCRAGGHLAGASSSELRALGRYGRHMGRLWHIAEDVSGLVQPDAGSHLLVRALSGRPVLPLVAAAELDPPIAEAWSQLVVDLSEPLADALAARLVRSPASGRAREIMVRESWSARRALSSLPQSRYRLALERLASSVVKAALIRRTPTASG